MAEAASPPLNYEPSATTTHPQVSTSLPPEVVACLNNARFLHLATCTSAPSPVPHVSLMNYTFLPSTPFAPHPIIVMTTNLVSLKTRNLLTNPRVSLLVHDWISHRPPTRTGSPPPAPRSSLVSMLMNMNTSSLSSISTTITGEAKVLQQGTEEEKWYKETHLQNNTFGDQALEEAGLFGGHVPNADASAEGSSCYISGEDVRVVLVRVREGRIADWKGGVKDWALVDENNPLTTGLERNLFAESGPAINGVIS